jgi:hypothetical protein
MSTQDPSKNLSKLSANAVQASSISCRVKVILLELPFFVPAAVLLAAQMEGSPTGTMVLKIMQAALHRLSSYTE